MSFCTKEGKDKIIFVTAEDHNLPSKIELQDDEEPVGLVKNNGDLNWNCPCLGGMATGPCGVDFREAFTCFHYSDADPKGSDCLEPFREMSACMAQFPGVYGSGDDNNPMAIDEDDEDDTRPAKPSSPSKEQRSLVTADDSNTEVSTSKDSGKEVASNKS